MAPHTNVPTCLPHAFANFRPFPPKWILINGKSARFWVKCEHKFCHMVHGHLNAPASKLVGRRTITADVITIISHLLLRSCELSEMLVALSTWELWSIYMWCVHVMAFRRQWWNRTSDIWFNVYANGEPNEFEIHSIHLLLCNFRLIHVRSPEDVKKSGF